MHTLPGADANCVGLVDVYFNINNIGNSFYYTPMYNYDSVVFEEVSRMVSEREFDVSTLAMEIINQNNFPNEFGLRDEELYLVYTALIGFERIFQLGSTENQSERSLPQVNEFLARSGLDISLSDLERIAAEFDTVFGYGWYSDALQGKARDRLGGPTSFADAFRPTSHPFVSGEIFGEGYETYNPRFSEFYVRQRSAETCYAASLTTVWRYFGWAASYDDFLAQRLSLCNRGDHASAASFIEIFNTTANMRVDGLGLFFDINADQWLAARINYRQSIGPDYRINESHSRAGFDRPNGRQIGSALTTGGVLASAVNPYLGLATGLAAMTGPAQLERLSLTDANGDFVSLYRPFVWNGISDPEREGLIRPIMDTGHLVYALHRGGAVLVGLNQGRFAHTVLATGVRYRPAGYIDQSGTIIITGSTVISEIMILDPSPAGLAERWMSADEFFEQFQFGLEIYENSI